jgi:serine/threonine protein kinase
MSLHGALENSGMRFLGVNTFVVHAFKRVESTVWSLVPNNAVCEHGFVFGPLRVPIACRRVLLIRSCECCLYLGEYQLQITDRSAALKFFQSQGSLFEDREFLASLEQRDSCLLGSLRGELVAVSKRASVNQLAREVEIFRLLQEQTPRSQRVVEFVGAFVDRDEKFLLATKYCRLGDLYSVLARQTFSLVPAIKLFRQILEGIGTLHQLGFVWRDCKPENIFMLDSETCCIADFSLACRLDDPDLQTTRCGTFGYTAPEVLMIPDKKITAKCDLWSAGSVLFDLLVGNSLCAVFRVSDADLKVLNRDVYCVWKGQGTVRFCFGDEKIKVDFKYVIVAELVAGLIERDAHWRITCDHALQICNLILASFRSLYDCLNKYV